MTTIWHPIKEKPEIREEKRLVFRAGVNGFIVHPIEERDLPNWKEITAGLSQWCYYDDILNALPPMSCDTCDKRDSSFSDGFYGKTKRYCRLYDEFFDNDHFCAEYERRTTDD